MDRNRHGFTLIELLIVVSIIALLLGMVLPTLRRAKQITARTVCASNLHAVGVGFYMYLEQSNEIMPVAAAMPSLHLNDDPRIADVLAPHLTHPKVLRCRADTDATSMSPKAAATSTVPCSAGKRSARASSPAISASPRRQSCMTTNLSTARPGQAARPITSSPTCMSATLNSQRSPGHVIAQRRDDERGGADS